MLLTLEHYLYHNAVLHTSYFCFIPGCHTIEMFSMLVSRIQRRVGGFWSRCCHHTPSVTDLNERCIESDWYIFCWEIVGDSSASLPCEGFQLCSVSVLDSPGTEKSSASLPLTAVQTTLQSFTNLSFLSHTETAQFLLEGGEKNALKRQQSVWRLSFFLSSEQCPKDVLLKSDETE